MSDIGAAIWDAIERRANDSDELARERRVAESRDAFSYYDFRDPQMDVPGRIDNERRKKRKR